MSAHFNPMAAPARKRPGQWWPRLVTGTALGLVLAASAVLVLTHQNGKIEADLLAIAYPPSEPDIQATSLRALPTSSAKSEESAQPETPVEPRIPTTTANQRTERDASTPPTMASSAPAPSTLAAASTAPAVLASVASPTLATANPEASPNNESLRIGPPNQAQLLTRSQQAFAAQDHAQVLALSQQNPDLGLRRLAIASHQALDQHVDALQLGISIPVPQRQDQDLLRLAISYEALAQKQSAIDFYQLFLRQSQHTELRQFAQLRLAQLKE